MDHCHQHGWFCAQYVCFRSWAKHFLSVTVHRGSYGCMERRQRTLRAERRRSRLVEKAVLHLDPGSGANILLEVLSISLSCRFHKLEITEGNRDEQVDRRHHPTEPTHDPG